MFGFWTEFWMLVNVLCSVFCMFWRFWELCRLWEGLFCPFWEFPAFCEFWPFWEFWTLFWLFWLFGKLIFCKPLLLKLFAQLALVVTGFGLRSLLVFVWLACWSWICRSISWLKLDDWLNMALGSCWLLIWLILLLFWLTWSEAVDEIFWELLFWELLFWELLCWELLFPVFCVLFVEFAAEPFLLVWLLSLRGGLEPRRQLFKLLGFIRWWLSTR